MDTRTRSPNQSRWLVLLMALVGCASPTDPGAEPGEPEVMDVIEGCKGVPTVYAFDQEASIGVSAADVVERYAGSYPSELFWTPPSSVVEHQLPEAIGGVEVEFEFDDVTEVRWVESLACDGMTSCMLNCSSRLEIPGLFRVTAEDGTLVEELEVMIAATKRGIHVVAPIALEDVQGSIGPDTFTLAADWTVIDYQLQAEVDDKLRLRGRFLADFISPDGALWFNAIGVWPPP